MYRWQDRLDQHSVQNVNKEAVNFSERRAPSAALDPLISDRIDYINTRASWLPASTQVALAKSYASDAAVDKIAGYSARQLVDNPQMAYSQLSSPPRTYYVSPGAISARQDVAKKKNPSDPGFVDDLYSNLKGISRAATSLGFAVTEGISTIASLDYGSDVANSLLNPFSALNKKFENKNQDLMTAAKSFTIFQLLSDFGNQGSGFFASEKMQSQAAENARSFRGTYGGSAFTIGRGAASLVSTPNTGWYNGISGLIDFSIALAAPDPNKLVVKGLGATASATRALKGVAEGGNFVDAFNLAKGVVPLVSKSDAIQFKNALHQEAGLEKTLLGMSLDVQKWNNFMDNNVNAVRAVKDISKTDDVVDIMKKFQWRITPEDAMSLAKAKTTEDIKKVLIDQYSIGGNTLSTDIYDIQPNILHNPGQFLVQKTPLKRSRLLMNLPENSIVINGDDQQRMQSIKNMILSLENAGATKEEVSNFGKEATKNFRAISSSDDQRDAYKVYESALKLTLKNNGVKNEVIQGILDRPKFEAQKLRLAMLDRNGIPTDNGMLKVYASMLKKYFPANVTNEMMEKIAETGNDGYAFARPMQLSQLFDRVQTLPDVREIRRLTTNPLMREALDAIGIAGKPTKALFSQIKKMEITSYSDDVRAKEIQDELSVLYKKSRKNVDNLRMNSLKDELESITKVEERRVYTGKPNMGIRLVDVIQNQIWKPFQLMTIGYAVRNSIDAQIRMSFGGSSGFLNHPGEYISLMIGETKATSRLNKLAKKAGLNTMERSLLGEALTKNGATELDALRRDHADLLEMSMRQQGLGAAVGGGHLQRTNQWVAVTKQSNESNYINGMVNQIRLAHGDPLTSLVARGRALGQSEDEILQTLLTVAKKEDNFKHIDGIYSRGVNFRNINGDDVFGPPRSLRGLDEDGLNEWLSMHINSSSVAEVDTLAGGIQEVNFMIAFNRVPKMSEVQVRPISDLVSMNYTSDLIPGTTVKLEDGEGIITRLDELGENVTIVPVEPGLATGGNFGHKKAHRIIRNAPQTSGNPGDTGLPLGVGMEMLYNSDKATGKAWLDDVQNGLDTLTDKLFGELYAKKFVRVTERSPVFRNFYYETIEENMGRLSKYEADRLLADLIKKTKNAGMGDDVGKYIGSTKTAERLKSISSGLTETGTVTAKELDDYARLTGLEKTKHLLYDASQKNNLEDITRIIMPFASAWRQVLGTYMGMMIEDPTIATRFGRYANTMYNSDPDKDGRGFFYKDPQTGESYFKFPAILGLPLGLNLTGTNAFFEAPVKQLSQGMSWMPGLGPIGQIPANWLLRNTPETSTVTQVVLPFGKKSVSQQFAGLNPAPSFATKIYDALTASKDNMNTGFANAYVDVFRAKSTTGDYDLTTDQGVKKLSDDSVRDARTISIFRALQQLIGPTSPTVGYKIKTPQGVDIYVDEMLKIFQKMQDENYDTSVQRFLNVFGEEAALYIGSKTRSLVPGLEASREFGEWELANSDVLNDYKTVGAYFAPNGSELNFDIWNRQLGEGKRVKLTDQEILESAQNRIGSAKFRAARKMFGANPNESQSQQLDSYRELLNKQYPGFPRVAVFTVGKYPNQILDLQDAVNDPRLSDNPLTSVLGGYLEERKKYLASVGGKSFDSKKATGARMYLSSYGEQLAAQSPEFARIWQRLLSPEVQD
jgi:hypothetical protein